MRSLLRIFASLNRPLPGWATLFLFVGMAAAAAAPGIYNASLILQVNGVGRGLDHGVEFQNFATSKPDAADSVGAISAYAADINASCGARQAVSRMWPGIVGAAQGNYGGYWVFWTKNDGACDGNEVLVLDAQQHIYMPNDEAAARFNTANSCTAGATCNTWTWTFSKPFLTITGIAQTPRCSGLGIMDETDSTQIWVGNLKNVSSTRAEYDIAPMVATGKPHTLDVYATCHDQAY